MGKFKDRVITTISADLITWRRTGSFEFIGTVLNSIEVKGNLLVDNQRVRITFIDVVHYPTLRGHWDEHFIGKTSEGKYIRMQVKHEYPVST